MEVRYRKSFLRDFKKLKGQSIYGRIFELALEKILADEARWDAQFAATQDGLKKMADKVRAEIRAGRTMPMVFTKDGRIAPG